MHFRKHVFRIAGDQRGMTLLEIMLALLILGTVVSMVSITLSGSLNILNATQEQGAIYHRAQIALLRISEDVASAVLLEDPDVNFIGNDEQTNGQGSDSLEFTSTAHVVFNQGVDKPGIALISYRVEEDRENKGEFVLVRSDELLALTDPGTGGVTDEGGFMLCDKLKSVNFTYIDEAGEEVDSWTTSPDALSKPTDRKLPVAVSCTLEFWVDQENDSSIQFTTSILLPVGLINAIAP